MTAITIVPPRASDAATLTASSEVATLPVTNLQNMQPKRKWRTNSALTPYIEIDTGAAGLAANGMLLFGGNGTASLTGRVRGKATYPVTSSPSIDTTALTLWPATGKPADENWPHLPNWLSWSNSTAYRYWRIDLADAGNAAGYLEFGRLMFGRYWQPTINVDFGGEVIYDQHDVQTVTEYGGTFTDRRNLSAPRLFQMQISSLDKREVFDGIADIRRLAGMWGDVGMILDTAATTDFHRLTGQCVFTGPQRHAFVSAFTTNGEMWSIDLPLREVI